MYETGLMWAAATGSFSTEEGGFVEATFGYGWIGVGEGEWTCLLEGRLLEEGPTEVTCPECAWVFDLSAPVDTTATGEYCRQFELNLAGDEVWGDSWDYVWGFAPVWIIDDVPVDDVLLTYLPENGWYPLAYDDGYSSWFTGDASHLEFVEPIGRTGDGVYYYYYPYR